MYYHGIHMSFPSWVSALAVVSCLWGASAQAFEFGDDEFSGSLDTTISHGVTLRVEKRSDRLAADHNGNDGNLNYDRGLVSNTSRFTSDLDLDYGDFGLFARFTGFIDFESQNSARARTPLSAAAKEQVGKDIDVLDLYVTGTFDAGEEGVLDLRLGNHVLNWGESTFIQNGVNGFNSFDVGKLRLPGSALREAVVPLPMASASLSPTAALSVEGFYQLDWEKTEVDPVGSYFSVVDYVGPGAMRAVVPITEDITDEGFGFGDLTPAINADLAAANPQACAPASPGPPPTFTGPACQPAFDSGFLNVVRNPDREPGDSGQWGVALRYFAEELNNTEFGFYFVNYHSRLPVVSANAGSRAGIQAGLFAAQTVGASDSKTITGIASAVTPVVTEAVTRQITAKVIEAVPSGTPQAAIDQAVAAELAKPETQRLIGEEVQAEVESRVSGIAQLLAIDRYGKTANYFVEYPENIRLFGLSFNTQLGTSGWALQGEYSFRLDAPLQRSEDSLFAEGLAPIVRALTLARTNPAAVPGFLANYRPSTLQGYVERNVSQVQATATKLIGPTFGADGMAFVTEMAAMFVHDMPDKSVRPLESPAFGDGAIADATSWGYRMAARLDYNNAVGAVNLFPYAQFQHDVSGNSPSPSGSFVEGRTALTLGLRADYLSRWEANLGYTRFAGRKNALNDRDFVTATVQYSF